MSGAYDKFRDDEVLDFLSDKLARLTGNARFTAVELAPGGATIWRVYRDENGTPQAEQPRFPPSAVADPDGFYRRVDPAFIVCMPGTLPPELADLLPLAGKHRKPVYPCVTSLEDHVREAIRDSPLVLGYELAVLRDLPQERPGAGRLTLAGHHLFPAGTSRGNQVKVRVRCEPTDGNGTVFAIVTREHRPNLPPNAQELQPVQIHSVVVPPGRYELTAVLVRPGRVRFEGLPGTLDDSAKPWDDLKRLIPDRLTQADPVHLICLIEACGGDGRLQSRIERLERLITTADTGTRTLLVSVISYGPHSVAWRVREEPFKVLAWATPSVQAIQELRGLIGRQADEREYLRAAQLECVLHGLAANLSDRDVRPVVVTAGGRPAHPHQMDPRTQLIPCPDHVNWRSHFNRLAGLRGITFGALRDQKWRGDIWQRLGRDAVAAVDDPVDMVGFAAALGLREAGQVVPFPFID